MKNPVTESLISTLNESGRPPVAETEYLRAYYHRLSGQDYCARKASDFRNIALTHQQLGKIRKPGETIVQLHNFSSPDTNPIEYEPPQTIIYVISDDFPFIVNSLRICLNRLGKTPHRTIHPVFRVNRCRKNIATGYRRYYTSEDEPDDNRSGEVRIESFVQFLVDCIPQNEHREITRLLTGVLRNIETVVEDWPRMKAQVLEKAEVLKSGKTNPQFSEYPEFFQWMTDDHFLFLGYCALELSVSEGTRKFALDPSSPLGILDTARKDGVDIMQDILPPVVFPEHSHVVFTKTRMRANIHRDRYMDCILVKQEMNAHNFRISCFPGFLAGSTAVLPTLDIPHIRKKASYVLSASKLRKNGHSYKELRNILETLPRDKLFHMELHQLYSLGMTLLNQERRKTRLHIHKNICGHFYSCLVYVPKDLFDTKLRTTIQNYLAEQVNAQEVEFDVYFSTSILTRIHFILHTDPEDKMAPAPPVDPETLEREVQHLARDWNEKLFESLKTKFGAVRASACLDDWRDGFSGAYQHDFPVEQAVLDIQILDHIPATGIRATLNPATRQNSGTDNRKRASFKLYFRQSSTALSDILPILENMGIFIHSGRPWRIRKTGGEEFGILDFDISRMDGAEFDRESNTERFESTFVQCWSGAIENDGFNRLTLLAGLTWREISMIRAYYRYLKQIRLRYSEGYIIDALTRNPRLVVCVVRLFDNKFNPAHAGCGNTIPESLNTEIKGLLEGAGTLDEERIIRALLDVVAATRRTNYFQPDAGGGPKSWISFKFSSRTIPRIPEPAPEYEIFVYSPRVEGVHLRGGKVARGGLRWSERPEDFRTEVLGLVKAQQVKNAVIVPVGSKGGFVARQLHKAKPGETLKEVTSCYRIFIKGLLDITDNLSGTEVVPPDNVVRLDGDDPYLVVAADKGTATFSDIANRISEQYDFWLTDAFASGGSAGYDHKKMGITARGAWESVKRHFRELGKNIQSSPFTVVGIGDMSGDVFGNGMLLSKQTRLVAAFNHQHIFIDPDPDPESSYRERKRLFELPRSSWADYDQDLISAGGGVFSRSEKSIRLSGQAKKLLDTNLDSCPPDGLISLILKADVELLWNGGIGTYVKSSSESHNNAQDRNNDSVRIDACDLRCRVIGEGGNLGMTQLARIEFSLNDGLCYTDAIDNSAGVDTSDHEVNIKILLNAQIQEGNLTVSQRNTLLAEMEDRVADLVLSNNYLQTQILSLETSFRAGLMPEQMRAIKILEDKGLLNRALEFLPDETALADRFEAGNYLTRPELAVLLSYSKMDLYQTLLDSILPDAPWLEREIIQYFPSLLSETYSSQIQRHRLKREIISTQVTNNLVGTMGATFHLKLADLTGAPPDRIVACWIAVRDITDNERLFAQIQELDNQVDTDIQMQCFNYLTYAIESSIIWLLRHTTISSAFEIGPLVNRFSGCFNTLIGNTASVVGNNDKRYRTRLDNLMQKGLPAELAHEVSARVTLVNGFDIIEIALECGRPVESIGRIYFGMIRSLGLSWLQNRISTMKVNNIWHERSKFSLSTDLRNHQADIASMISRQSTTDNPEAALSIWKKKNRGAIRKLKSMTEDLRKETAIDMSMLSVLVSELGQLRNSA